MRMDYLTYNGNVSDPVAPSKNWSVVKDVADMFQILYCTPLTKQQMAKIGMDTTLVSVEPINSNIPSSFELEQNYPNPFNPSTTIRYSIPKSSYVELKVYDGLGNLVQSLVSEYLNAGTYESTFNGASLSSGVYYYQIKAGEFTATKKLVLMK
uniref:T9SS type A sorting domain-containing protein n=1 Tax=Ignavibacterium album TaxID=591197 RepID=A0A832G2E7_9BACT